MKVTFRTSLGSRDAVELGLDHIKCTVGAVIDVDAKTAVDLVARGLCEPFPIKAIPKPAAIAKAKPAAIAKEKE